MYLSIFDHIESPDAVAIADRFGKITYPGLRELVDRFSELLEAQGCIKKRVILEGGNHRNLVALMLALSGLDNEIIVQEIKSTPAETANLVNDYLINLSLNADTVSGFEGLGSPHIPVSFLSDHDHGIKDCKFYYLSSGSTGKPKIYGFHIPQLSELLEAWYVVVNRLRHEVVLCPLTMTHFHGTVISLTALLNGHTLVFCHTDHLDVGHLTDILELHRPSIMTGTPYHYQKLFVHLTQRPHKFEGFSNMRFAFCGSAPLSKSLADSYFKEFGIYINQGYGVSEIGIICIDTDPSLGLGTVGQVIPSIEYRIIDESGKDVRPDEQGELIVRAAYMTDGYLQQEALTRNTFKDGWLYTGDIVSEDSMGRITIVGRKSNFINIHGLKVYPAEIEKVIISWDPALSVAVREEEDGGKLLMTAYIENHKGNPEPDLESLKAYLKKNLANYKQPSRYVLVDELPKNALGKVRYYKIDQSLPTTHL